MLQWLIDLSLRYRGAVLLAVLGVVFVGGWSLRYLDIDAFPDTTPVMVQINTVAPALTPEEVERQITFPVEQAIGGLPGLEKVRSISKFGLSQVVVVFEDGTDIYFARQLVTERRGTVALPEGIARPTLGPVSSGLGEVFHYIVTRHGVDFSRLPDAERVRQLTELRTLHDWVIKPALRRVDGVAEINTWGGYEQQLQVRFDPQQLIKYDLTFDDLVDALQRNNRNVGGGTVTDAGRMLLVYGQGRTTDAQQVGNIVIAARHGVPIRVRDVAQVDWGHDIRRGAVSANGRGEAILGLGFMLMGENPHQVAHDLRRALDEVRATLPPDVHVYVVYDRTELVDHVIHTVRNNLFEGGLLVVAVLFAFLGNLRAGLIVALAIPLSMLFAFSGMLRCGIAASLLSLGAIDFGLVVDSSVVMVENCARRLAHPSAAGRNRIDVIRDAALEVRKPTMFGELIIMIVYLPILTLEGVEGKLYRPMALTVIFALAGSMLLSLTLMPVLTSFVLSRGVQHGEPLLVRAIRRLYAPVLRFTMHRKGLVLALAALVLLVAFGYLAPQLGSEFVPRLSEGAIAINVVRLAGTDLEESIRYNTQMERAVLQAFPDEVAHVWSRIGTAEVATDPMGLELTDMFIALRPRSGWTRARTQDELTGQVHRLLRDLPGQRIVMTQPIEMRINEMISGVRSDVAAILFGDDFELLGRKAQEIERVLQSIPGAADISTEQITGQPELHIRVKQEAIARYGVPVRHVLEMAESLGTYPVGEVYQGPYRFPLAVRLADKYRTNLDVIRAIPLATASGEQIPLSRLADVEVADGYATIKREWYQRRVAVTCNVRGRDLGSFVDEARHKVAQQVPLPPGRYRVEWGGQFEHLARAKQRLWIVVPLALGLILLLLYLTYNNLVDAMRVFTSVPFAWTGGIFALWLRGMPFSISAAIGFVALSGVAVLDDMLLVSTIRRLRRDGMDLESALQTAAMTRLRPVLMTTLVASLGFVPMAINTGMGAEVQRPLATVVIGGVLSATIMSLLVLRVLYMVFAGPGGGRKPSAPDHRAVHPDASPPAWAQPELSAAGSRPESSP